MLRAQSSDDVEGRERFQTGSSRRLGTESFTIDKTVTSCYGLHWTRELLNFASDYDQHHTMNVPEAAARIIPRHGGRIWVMAAVNEGATFFFTLGGRADLLSDQSNSSFGFKAA